jgi:hypothetical protein
MEPTTAKEKEDINKKNEEEVEEAPITVNR